MRASFRASLTTFAASALLAGDAEVDRHRFRPDRVSRSELQRERRQRLLDDRGAF